MHWPVLIGKIHMEFATFGVCVCNQLKVFGKTKNFFSSPSSRLLLLFSFLLIRCPALTSIYLTLGCERERTWANDGCECGERENMTDLNGGATDIFCTHSQMDYVRKKSYLICQLLNVFFSLTAIEPTVVEHTNVWGKQWICNKSSDFLKIIKK